MAYRRSPSRRRSPATPSAASTPAPRQATVLSTTPDAAPTGDEVGMRLTVTDGTLTLDDRGLRVATTALPPPRAPCTFGFESDSGSRRPRRRPTLARASTRPPVTTGRGCGHLPIDAGLDPMGGTTSPVRHRQPLRR
ncbi:hypothetical protein HBB16_08065 [Pseudonocardia sp. MCCB 268]|nr:hypothetical protein [Pseudonocardia cytotoxica]